MHLHTVDTLPSEKLICGFGQYDLLKKLKKPLKQLKNLSTKSDQ